MYFSRSQFALLSAVLLLLFENVASVLPLYSSVLLTLLRDWQHNEERLRQTIFDQNKAIARYNRIRQRKRDRKQRRMWKKAHRTDEFWQMMWNGEVEDEDWKSNFRMGKADFMELVEMVREKLTINPEAVRNDCLSAEKRVAMTLYYLSDLGTYKMTCNAFGVSKPTLSKNIRMVCKAIVDAVGPVYLRLPKTKEEAKVLIDAFEAKFGFPQVIGCIDGTHIPIRQPTENPQDFFCYKMKYSLNCQAVCDEKGQFIDVDIRWPGSCHDAKIFANSTINKLLKEQKFPSNPRKLVAGMPEVPPFLIGDPAYPLLPSLMKEYSHCSTNDEVVFNAMLRSTRNQIECAFGRLKARWRILMRAMDINIDVLPSVIYACFILHNFCEAKGNNVPTEKLQHVLQKERVNQACKHHTEKDPIYSHKTADGASIRQVITTYFSKQ